MSEDDLIIHCAVLSKPTKESVELLEYLLKTCPEYIEKKTSDGDSPLMLACKLGRIEYTKILLSGGADQSTKNAKGENIIHAALHGNPTAQQVKILLDLLDADLRSHLFLQRKSLQENGTTPLHTWVSQTCGLGIYEYNPNQRFFNRNNSQVPWVYHDQSVVVAMAKLLLDYSHGEELDTLNGAGETCLHTAVKCDLISLVKVLVDFKPQLLNRENAVGRTPAELAHDQLQSQTFERPVHNSFRHHENISNRLLSKDLGDFAGNAMFKEKSPAEIRATTEALGLSGYYEAKIVGPLLSAMGTEKGVSGSALSASDLKKIIWDLCSTALTQHPSKRRLVSLNEANDVARRLGEKHSSSRYFSVQNRNDDDDEKSQDGAEDVNTQDFAARELANRSGWAWKFTSYEAEQLGIKKCDGCSQYHM